MPKGERTIESSKRTNYMIRKKRFTF